MLYEQNYTIAGAKKKLKEEFTSTDSKSDDQYLIEELLTELKSLKDLLG